MVGQSDSGAETPASSWLDKVLGWRRLTALVAGAIGAVGYPPLGLWPATLASIAVLIWLVRDAPRWKAAAMRGWLFGVAHLTIANNWIATAFTHQSEMPAFLGWIAVPLLCLYLAIYPALASALTHRLAASKAVPVFVAVFAALWIVTEWLRSWVFTGYPWPPLGLALLGPFDRPGWAAVLPFTGTYALSGLAVLFAGAILWALGGRRWLALAGTAAVVIAGSFWPAGEEREGTLRYTLVQPNFDQATLNDPRQYEPSFLTIAAFSVREQTDEPRLVLWPESALPDYLRPGYPLRYYVATTARADPEFARQRVADVIGENSLLLTGATDLEIGTDETGRERALGAYNVVTALDDQGDFAGSYSKAHLVPYGEYLALRWLLEPLGASRLVAGTIDFIPGPGPRTLELGEYGDAGIQICYEIVFSGQVTDRRNRPDYIFNPSNDGWFGAWGPPQHLAQARLRAIEEGLPVLRSTTTGISAVIDARGVVRRSLGAQERDKLDGFVPPAHAPTWFARAGNWLPLGWAFLLMFGALIASVIATRRAAR
ncbi:apolipoprotein N-acyltransferase [Qipengyuania sp. DSG2-2]|uniref:apolipoprotein N-acyltransferase n=1 Tax=Qipengyuania sp. DGS2-2 TaxID=3349631 RepID=UPI0036D37874